MLIVEDQDVMRPMLVEYVQSAYPDAAITEAADGASALELCRSGSPQLVLMDVGLPDANGIYLDAHAVAQITAKFAEALADGGYLITGHSELTALTMKGDRGWLLAEGFDGYLERPIGYKEFLARVAALLEGQYQ